MVPKGRGDGQSSLGGDKGSDHCARWLLCGNTAPAGTPADQDEQDARLGLRRAPGCPSERTARTPQPPGSGSGHCSHTQQTNPCPRARQVPTGSPTSPTALSRSRVHQPRLCLYHAQLNNGPKNTHIPVPAPCDVQSSREIIPDRPGRVPTSGRQWEMTAPRRHLGSAAATEHHRPRDLSNSYFSQDGVWQSKIKVPAESVLGEDPMACRWRLLVVSSRGLFSGHTRRELWSPSPPLLFLSTRGH